MTDGDAELAQKIADDLGEEIWNDREKLVLDYKDLDEAIDEAVAESGKTFVFADVNDNPGAGASGDSTHILRRLIERGVGNVLVATIFDPETAAQAARAGVGATIDAKIGGKLDPQINGQPIECKAYVKAITDGAYATKDYCPGTRIFNGTTAVLVTGGIEIIVNSLRTQPYDMEVIRSSGITPEEKNIIVVKSSVHFRASYEKIACKVFNIDKPALAVQDPAAVGLTHVRRPIYPLDK